MNGSFCWEKRLLAVGVGRPWTGVVAKICPFPLQRLGGLVDRKRGRVGCEASDCSPFGWRLQEDPPGSFSKPCSSVCVCVDDLRINFAHRNSESVGLEPFQNMRSICAHQKIYTTLFVKRHDFGVLCWVEWKLLQKHVLDSRIITGENTIFPNVRWKTWIVQAKHSEIQLLLEEWMEIMRCQQRMIDLYSLTCQMWRWGHGRGGSPSGCS